MQPILNFYPLLIASLFHGLRFKQGSAMLFGTVSQFFSSHIYAMNSSISFTLLDIGPISDLTGVPEVTDPQKLFPNLEYLFPGFKVINPLYYAGTLKLPPMSDPNPMGEQYDPISPPYPPELPPHDLYSIQGFLQYPKIKLLVSFVLQEGGTVVLTKGMNPIRMVIQANRPFYYVGQFFSCGTTNPQCVALPLSLMISLQLAGMPKNGGKHFYLSLGSPFQFLLCGFCLLCSSHYFAVYNASSNISSSTQLLLIPMTEVLSAKIKITYSEVVYLFSINSTSSVAVDRITFSFNFGLILAKSYVWLSLKNLILSWRLCLKSQAFWRISLEALLPAPIVDLYQKIYL